jgi:hypothetical protein
VVAVRLLSAQTAGSDSFPFADGPSVGCEPKSLRASFSFIAIEILQSDFHQIIQYI